MSVDGSSGTESKRMATLDGLRALAAFGVVWTHACDTNRTMEALGAWTAIAVPCFLLISFYLLQSGIYRTVDRLPGTWLYLRLRRILPAYATWSLAYLIVRVLKRWMVNGEVMYPNWLSVIFMGGAAYQLYFLALLVYFTMLVINPMVALARLPRRMQYGAAAGLILAGASLAWLGSLIAGIWSAPPAYSMLNHALGLMGYVPLGIAAAVLFPAAAQRASLFVPVTLVACILVIALRHVLARPAGTMLLSCGIFVLCLGAPTSAGSQKQFVLSRLSYGVFLLHAFFVEGLQHFIPRAGFSITTTTGTFLVIAVAYGMAVLCSGLFSLSPKTRWLVL